MASKGLTKQVLEGYNYKLLRVANVAQLVEQRFRKPQVKGSSPFIGSIFRGVAQFGSAFGSGPKGRRFKSCHLDQKKPETERFPVLFLSLLQNRAVFGAFFMQRMCNLGERAKDM